MSSHAFYSTTYAPHPQGKDGTMAALEQFMAALGEPTDRPISIITTGEQSRKQYRGTLETGFYPEVDTRELDPTHPNRRPDLAHLRVDASPWVCLPNAAPVPLDRILCGHEKGVTFRPNWIHHENESWVGSRVLFAEWDDLAIEGQRKLIDRLTAMGLGPTAIVFSGSKSLHCYWALNEFISDAEQWKSLMAWFAVALLSDSSIPTLHREMRLPGAYRLKDGEWREQALLESHPDRRYSVGHVAAVLQQLCPLPYGMNSQRFRDWKAAVSGMEREGYSGPTPEEILNRDYIEWNRQQQAERDRRAAERAAARERIEASGQIDWVSLISQAEDRLGWDAFLPYLKDYEERGGKVRCLPVFRTGSGSLSDYIDEHNGKLLYTDSKGQGKISGFRFWLWTTYGYGIKPRGREFVERAKEFCRLAGIDVLEQTRPPVTATPALKELARIEERAKVTIAPTDAVNWFEEGTLAETITDCKSKGYRYILNSSVTGSGKSNSAGLLTPDELGASRIWCVNPDHRNPTTQTLVDGWVDLPARHGGLSREVGPDGQPQLRRTKPGGTADVWRNCEQIDTLDQLRAKNIAGADTAGTICKGCPSFAICSTPQDPVTYRGPDYLFYRRAAMAAPKLRAHPDSLPHAGNHDYRHEILIFDDCQPKTSRTLDVTLADIVATEIECRDRGLVNPVLMALLRSLRELLKGEFPRYGIGHADVLAALPDVSGIDAVVIDAALAPDLSFLEPDAVEGRVKGKGSLNHLLKEEQLRQNQQIAQNLPKVWLGDFIRVVQGGTGETVRATSAGLTLTLRDNTHRDICKSAQVAIFADATNSVQNLAKQLGVDPSEIIEIRQRMPEGATLNCIQIFDLGRVTRDRGEDQKRRVAALQAALDKEGKLGVIDFKAFEGADRFGAWFRDSRGSNAFQDCDNILAIGTPCQNLSSLLAEYCLLEGRNVAMEDQCFKDWVTWKILVEVEQAKGRLRASRRAGEVLNFYLVSDLQSDQGGIDGFEQAKACEVSFEAGAKGERIYTRMLSAATEMAKTGQKVTQSALARIVGISQGRISQLAKLFQGSWDQFLELLILLVKPYSKINNAVPEDAAETVDAMRYAVSGSEGLTAWYEIATIYLADNGQVLSWILSRTPLEERKRWIHAVLVG